MARVNTTSFGDRIARAATEAGDASADLVNAAENADLLKAVEQTVDALQSEERHVNTIAEHVEYLASKITATRRASTLDPDDETESMLQNVQNAVRSAYRTLHAKRQKAVEDSRLGGEKEDAVVVSFDRATQAHERIHEALEDLRMAILEHDAEVDKRNGNTSGPFDDIDALIDKIENNNCD